MEKNRQVDATTMRVDQEATAALKGHDARLRRLQSVSEAAVVTPAMEESKDNNELEERKVKQEAFKNRTLIRKFSTSSRKSSTTRNEDEGSNMGSDATIRYQKTRLKVLQDELDVANDQITDVVRNTITTTLRIVQ